jgi:hypothetical protein
MTEEQYHAVWHLLGVGDYREAHHGDCIGADATFHSIARALEIPVVLHPPDDDRKRAHSVGVIHSRTPAPYLVRNRNIVQESDVLIATPGKPYSELRSGTWATIRAAQRAGVPVDVVWPSGDIDRL